MTTSNYFAAGHRMRIEVSSSNFPRFDRNLNTGGNNYDETTGLVAHNTVHHSTEYPSSLKITVVKGDEAGSVSRMGEQPETANGNSEWNERVEKPDGKIEWNRRFFHSPFPLAPSTRCFHSTVPPALLAEQHDHGRSL